VREAREVGKGGEMNERTSKEKEAKARARGRRVSKSRGARDQGQRNGEKGAK
jgi:hypothetical protein